MGICGVVFVVLLVLKLIGCITLGWIGVFLVPIGVSLGFYFIILIFSLLGVTIGVAASELFNK